MFSRAFILTIARVFITHSFYVSVCSRVSAPILIGMINPSIEKLNFPAVLCSHFILRLSGDDVKFFYQMALSTTSACVGNRVYFLVRRVGSEHYIIRGCRMGLKLILIWGARSTAALRAGT
jgi:hypothetical protein